ncbi:restriction endonuclease subunit S [Fusobacterium hwasookii]|uniref:Type I restriction enzyme n=1 Tax=Fusobacterium hwasookii ChDC F128 TaxID=1216362 RepID=A0ABN0GYJ9_9FUSO|nr:type I restriction enzyme [Fusobacterium hwasookii ChDC F128]
MCNFRNIKLELAEVFELKNGYTPSKSISEYWENGDINWFKIEDINTNGRVLNNSIEKVNKKGIKGKLFPKNTLIISTSATIGEYALITKEFLCNQRFTCLITKEEYKDVVLPMFLKHYAYILSKKCRENIKVGNFPSVDMNKFKKIPILLPPLEVQKRIVEVLDNFEKICNDLNIDLPAEIEARQKQYEFYRNFLLTFKEDSVNSLRQDKTRQDIYRLLTYIFGYINLELGEILKIKNGSDYKKFNTGNIPVYGSGGIINYTDTYIYDKESVLIPRKGSIGNLFYVDKPFWTVDTIFYTVIDKDIVIPKYIYYYLSKVNLEKLNTAGGVPSLTQTVLNKILIPLPPLEEQQRIVDILDRFDKLCNDISEGLPAEIEARQKQYEYFREKLLTFKNIND